jgi:hypothetical protein
MAKLEVTITRAQEADQLDPSRLDPSSPLDPSRLDPSEGGWMHTDIFFRWLKPERVTNTRLVTSAAVLVLALALALVILVVLLAMVAMVVVMAAINTRRLCSVQGGCR